MRVLGRLVDDIKGNAASLSMAGLAETAGRMGMVVRSGGGMPTKVRGLRELQGSLKINYDAAMRVGHHAWRTGRGRALRRQLPGLGRPAAPLGEHPVDERSSQQDDHEMDQHADEQGHVGKRPQDEPGTNGCEKDSKPMHRTASGRGSAVLEAEVSQNRIDHRNPTLRIIEVSQCALAVLLP